MIMKLKKVKNHDFYQKATLQHKSGVSSYHAHDKINTERRNKESINPRHWYVQDFAIHPLLYSTEL